MIGLLNLKIAAMAASGQGKSRDKWMAINFDWPDHPKPDLSENSKANQEDSSSLMKDSIDDHHANIADHSLAYPARRSSQNPAIPLG